LDSLYRQQKADKPAIEDVIPECLDGEARKLALDIAAFLRANRMSPTWASWNSWKSSYKGKGISYIKLLPDTNTYKWAVDILPLDRHKYEDWVCSEGLVDKFTEKPWYCHGCGRPAGESCGGRRDFTVNGREIKGVCGHNFMKFICDPGVETVDGIKRFLESEKAERMRSNSNDKRFQLY